MSNGFARSKNWDENEGQLCRGRQRPMGQNVPLFHPNSCYVHSYCSIIINFLIIDVAISLYLIIDL